MAQARSKPNRVYRANQEMAAKSCSLCGQAIRPGQRVIFNRDTVQRTGQPAHSVCPQRHVTVRFVPVT